MDRDSRNNPEEAARQANAARIHKAARAWKDLLYTAEGKQVTGTLSIVVPVESGRIGKYRTVVMPPADS